MLSRNAHKDKPLLHTPGSFCSPLHSPNHNTFNNPIQEHGRKCGSQNCLPFWTPRTATTMLNPALQQNQERNTLQSRLRSGNWLCLYVPGKFLNFFLLNPFRFYFIYFSVSFVASGVSSIQPHHNEQCNMPAKRAFLNSDSQHHGV